MPTSLEQLRTYAQNARDLLPERVGIDEVLFPQKLMEVEDRVGEIPGETAAEKVHTLKLNMARLERCKTAGEVMAEFSNDAAGLKVVEMYTAMDSSDRQRAQETVLNYALGKPVERKMSIEMRVSNSSDKELENEIQRLLHKLGFEGGKGTTTALLIDAGNEEGLESAQGIQAESGVSAEVPHQHSQD